MMSLMRLKKLHIALVGLGILGAAVYGLLTPASAQAPQGPAPFSRQGPGPAAVAGPVVGPGASAAPTLMQSVLGAPGRTVIMEEYRVGETQVPGVVAEAEAAPFVPPTSVRFLAAVVCERGREDQRHKGLKIVIERPLPGGQADQVVCFVDRGEMQPLASALTQLADAARREREGGRDYGRGRDAGRRDRPTARSAGYSTADFAVTVRAEGGRPTIEVRNPNRPDSRVVLGADAVQGTLDQWGEWIGSAHLLLERK